MREALECEFVSKRLPAWIDLIFGCKQNGEEARLAFNLFHPLTYEGAVDVDAIQDPVERAAAIAQINSYGQVPRQLFTKPHPARLQLPTVPNLLQQPVNLKALLLFRSSRAVGSVSLVHSSPVALGLRELVLFPEATVYLSWGEWDQTLRVCSLQSGRVLMDLEQFQDELFCAHTPPSGRIVVFGGSDRLVQVWKKKTETNKLHLKHAATLAGHESAVQCVFVSDKFSIAVSGASSTLIIWDMNRLRFIRSMPVDAPVTCVSVSPINGNIVAVIGGGGPLVNAVSSGAAAAQMTSPKKLSLSVSDPAQSASSTSHGCSLLLFNVNGELLARQDLPDAVLTCVAFTAGMEGVAENFVLAGSKTGKVHVYREWDLALIATQTGVSTSPISCLALDDECNFFVTGSLDGTVQQWVNGISSGSQDSMSQLGI